MGYCVIWILVRTLAVAQFFFSVRYRYGASIQASLFIQQLYFHLMLYNQDAENVNPIIFKVYRSSLPEIE
jgi:hypothetical protein